MRDHDPAAVKPRMLRQLRQLATCAATESREVLDALYAPDASWLGCHPVDQLRGTEAIETEVWAPLRRALRGLRRRDDIFMGGAGRMPTGSPPRATSMACSRPTGLASRPPKTGSICVTASSTGSRQGGSRRAL